MTTIRLVLTRRTNNDHLLAAFTAITQILIIMKTIFCLSLAAFLCFPLTSNAGISLTNEKGKSIPLTKEGLKKEVDSVKKEQSAKAEAQKKSMKDAVDQRKKAATDKAAEARKEVEDKITSSTKSLEEKTNSVTDLKDSAKNKLEDVRKSAVDKAAADSAARKAKTEELKQNQKDKANKELNKLGLELK